MRACPTQAVRVKEGKASVISELCIDCGQCLTICPSGAITATTLPFEELHKFKFKVAVPCPVLFTQFPINVSPSLIGSALLELGFDAVWGYSVDIELVDRAIRDCVENWKGPFPLISSSCPVVVRLVQVAYPTMVEQLIPLEVPRETAGRELKRKYSQELGLKPEEIAAIYITPCQAKTISILQPAEEAESYLDGSVAISEIYNDMLAFVQRRRNSSDTLKGDFDSNELFRWGMHEGEYETLFSTHYMPLMGLGNIIRVFNDIEKGKIRGIEFLECHACHGGCIGGNLTVDNLYSARSKKMHLISTMPAPSPGFEREVERRCAKEDFSLRGPLRPRATRRGNDDLREQVSRRKKTGEILKLLPQLNCGLCGAPTCKDHAEDASVGSARLGDCVFLSPDRVDLLKKVYLKRLDNSNDVGV
jgi:Fe-S-cluster-containing hydrogenase component 2